MDRATFRILDANFNRSREALRVMEDYARFALDDTRLTTELKNARQQLRDAAALLDSRDLLSARNTPGDVGTALSSPGEMDRPDALAVVTAACKRATESLRVLEEFSKTIQAQAAKTFERLRYQCYDWEVCLISRGQAAKRLRQMRLYVLISSHLCKKGPFDVAKEVLAGGADCLQLREKQLNAGQYLTLAKKLADLCHEHDRLFIVNDRPDVAAAAGADGVHLGQEDLPLASARQVLPSRMTVGLSTHNIDQARKALNDGADYIGVGPVFATGTKPTAQPVGTEYVRQAAEIDLPQAVIGGINLDNLSEVLNAGAKCVAVCSAIICSENPAVATRRFAERLKAYS